MDVNFFDQPSGTPKPRSEMTITTLVADPYPDKRRVKVEVETTAFTPNDKPNIRIEATNADELEVASMTIIASMHRQMTLTLHVREPEPSGQYTLSATLFYEEEGEVDTHETTFELS